MKKSKLELHIFAAAACALLFVLLMALVTLADVQPIGPEGSIIGLAGLNGAVRDSLGYRPTVYLISELLGYLALLTPVYFGIMGLKQLLQTKSLGKVEPDLYILALAYVLMAMFYVFFELCVLNYRPVLMEGELEASFPSSHTMLSITLLGTAASQFRMRMPHGKQGQIAVIVCYGLMAAIVLTRLVSGVHWLTDILGGLLLGTMLVEIYEIGIAFLRNPQVVLWEDEPAALPKRKLVSLRHGKPLPDPDAEEAPTPKKGLSKLFNRYEPKH